MSEAKGSLIEGLLSPISIKTAEIILDQMKNCACKIHKEGNTGNGFFLEVPYNNESYKLLVTDNHVFNAKEIMPGNKISISLNNGKIFKEIKIDSERKRYTN